jgi:hypothetical protein
MKKTILTKKSNYHKIISLSAILLCATALAGCNPKSNKDANHHVTKTEHVKKHKKAKKTASSSSKANSSKSLSSSSSSLANSSSPSSQRVSSSSASVTTAATSSSQSAATHTATSASQQSSIQSSQQSTQHSTTATNSKTPAQTTSGFNVNGHHFDIGSFSGTGLVPSDKVYQWSSLNGWYLIDINSVAAGYASSLGVGSAVTVNGRTYHVTHVLYNQPNNSTTLSTVQSMLGSNAIGWQICNSEGHMSNLNLWFAN